MIPVTTENATEVATRTKAAIDARFMPCGWVSLWTPSGVHVTLPVTATALDYDAMLANVELMIAAGLTQRQPGVEVEDGEHHEQVGWLCRRAKENRDRSETHIIDVYPDAPHKTWRELAVYLNTDHDVAEFEAASCMRITDLPLFVGPASPQRGASRQTDQFIVQPGRPFGVVYVANPKYSEEAERQAKAAKQTYTVPKRMFVRWTPNKGGTATTPDRNSSLREMIAAKFQAARSRQEYLAICSEVASSVTAGNLNETDRSYLMPFARATSAKFPEPAPCQT